ncbi:MAG: hypothetical protein IPK20_26210 [Betaproteobacteria bacterium]|nr:hypothetical protein [Betaproteobacteria bacterium]
MCPTRIADKSNDGETPQSFARRQEEHREELQRQRPWAPAGDSGADVADGAGAIFAPGPDDPRWARIVADRPDLAPAVEPGLCVLVDGLADVVDDVRADPYAQSEIASYLSRLRWLCDACCDTSAIEGRPHDPANKSLPPPLVPADVDLRGLEYMPLMGHHLFGSDFNTTNNDAAWRQRETTVVVGGIEPRSTQARCPTMTRRCAVWRGLAAQRQKAWKPLREIALRNFVKCSDGRLYHPFLCKQALVAWDKRVKERKRKADYRAKKDAEREGQGAVGPNAVPRDKTRTETGTGRGPDADEPPLSR